MIMMIAGVIDMQSNTMDGSEHVIVILSGDGKGRKQGVAGVVVL